MGNCKHRIVLGGLLLIGTALGCEQRDTVGPDGGTVASADGRVVVEFAAGAVEQETLVVVDEVEGCMDGALRCYEVWPTGTMLAIPARVTYFSDPSEDVSETVLMGSQGSDWFRLPDRGTDADLGTVQASLTVLSTLGVAND